MATARRAGDKVQGLDSDLLQQANIGLLKAADRFDPDMGFRFSTYAEGWIRAEIQEYKIHDWSLVRLPNSASGRKLFHSFSAWKPGSSQRTTFHLSILLTEYC